VQKQYNVIKLRMPGTVVCGNMHLPVKIHRLQITYTMHKNFHFNLLYDDHTMYPSNMAVFRSNDVTAPHLFVNGLFSQQQHPRRMLCLVLFVLPHQRYSSEVDSRQNCSRVHTSNLTESVSASL